MAGFVDKVAFWAAIFSLWDDFFGKKESDANVGIEDLLTETGALDFNKVTSYVDLGEVSVINARVFACNVISYHAGKDLFDFSDLKKSGTRKTIEKETERVGRNSVKGKALESLMEAQNTGGLSVEQFVNISSALLESNCLNQSKEVK